MYVLQDKPDEKIIGKWSGCNPLATLKSEHGNATSHIINDDHCYVLLLDNGSGHGFVVATHWFKEAVEASRLLPLPE